jgi:hypothetical protein
MIGVGILERRTVGQKKRENERAFVAIQYLK